ncbi:MAG TPA: hypothetical protein VJU86_04325 [Pyrinomonadaceae bacterium]|nr:hypothetical protein [Pyrinomonadaceae bacterium]
MFIFSQLLLGLVCVHLLLVYFYVTGSLVWSKARSVAAKDNDEPFPMADFVITSATGIAITGFVILFFGFLGLLSAGGFVVWLVIEGFLFKVLSAENVLSSDFWRRRLTQARRAWSLPALSIYFVFLIISVPAILPPTAFDATMFHLANAVNWANAGHIYADEFLRFPYYANNFVLLYSLMFVLKLSSFCHFLTWLCGLLAGWAVYSVIANEGVRNSDRRSDSGSWRNSIVAVIIVLGLALSPVFLRWVDTAMLDVPIALFILVPILCVYLGLQTSARKYELELVITAAFCAGMKVVFFLFVPLFVGSLVLLLFKRREAVSRVLVLCGLLLVLSAPWYLRNFIATGDPISPSLNILFHRKDPIWSRADYAGVLVDLKTPKDPASLLRMPVDLFWNTTTINFREYGTSPIVLLLYLPVVMAILLIIPRVRARLGLPFVYLNLVLIYLFVYWIGISSLARYFLHLFPVYLVYIGVGLNALLRFSGIDLKPRFPRYVVSSLAVVIIAVAMLYPTPSVTTYYTEFFWLYYQQMSTRFTSRDGYLRRNVLGYSSTKHITSNLHNPNSKVLLVGFESLHYFFRNDRIVSLGDWFGPGRITELLDSINKGDLSTYLARFNIGAVLIRRPHNAMDQSTLKRFTKQLEENHFVLQPTQEAGTTIYIKAQ